jgi:hypothetical protein
MPYPDRDAILLALIAEHQRSPRPHPLWQSLLVVAFEPMFCNLRRRTFGSKEDLDARIFLAFLDAVQRVAVSARKERGPDDLTAHGEREDQKREVVAALVDLVGGEAEAREVLDVLVHARTGSSQLVDFIAERHPEMSKAQRASAYARLVRLRRLALVRLEERFGASGTVFDDVRAA